MKNSRSSTLRSTIDLSWYDAWLPRELKNIPYCLSDLRVGQTIEMVDCAQEPLGAQRLLVSAALGWRPMLYQTAFNICSLEELAIHQPSDRPYSGLVFDTYK